MSVRLVVSQVRVVWVSVRQSLQGFCAVLGVWQMVQVVLTLGCLSGWG